MYVIGIEKKVDYVPLHRELLQTGHLHLFRSFDFRVS